MNVERPRASSSAAPTLENSCEAMPIRADAAGTKEPDWASSAMSAFCLKYVDFPDMLGPVRS